MAWMTGHCMHGTRSSRPPLADSCLKRPMIAVLQCHWLLSCACHTATHERVLASGGAAKLPRSAPWSIYNADRVLDLEAEASTSGSDSDEAADS